MDETSNLNFLTALGQEFCWALSPPVADDLILPQDGYEVWRRAFGTDPSWLASPSRRWSTFGPFAPATSSAQRPQVQLAVSRILARWPAG